MNLHRGFEIYNADGKEITYQELNLRYYLLTMVRSCA